MRISRLVATAVLAQALLSAHGSHVNAAAEPSWCTRANKPTHYVICNEPSLWILDQCEEKLYAEVRQIARRAILGAVARNEAAWVNRRNQCRTDFDCIVDEYADRIDELQQVTNSQC